MKTETGQTINIGDILKSKDGYFVEVFEDNGEMCGKLICLPGHPCENISYALNNGNGYRHATPRDEKNV